MKDKAIPEHNEEMDVDFLYVNHMNFENLVVDVYALQGNDNL